MSAKKREKIHHTPTTDNSFKLLFLRTSIAGAFAGTIEHLVTFPFDTIKTRQQFRSLQAAVPPSNGLLSNAAFMHSIVQQEGIARLYRGLTAILVGAVPSHSLYFATYEASKRFFGIAGNPNSAPHLVFVSGALATVAHDAVVTPLDVIKQRMQLPETKGGFVQITKTVLRKEGVGMFFRSLPTTVAINVPYQGVYFVTYEALKSALTKIMKKGKKIRRSEEGVVWLMAGAMAGAIAGTFSTPLDVVKTFIQTHPSNKDLNTAQVMRRIVRRKGARLLFAGAGARAMTCAPAAGICWTAYETMKRLLGWNVEEI